MTTPPPQPPLFPYTTLFRSPQVTGDWTDASAAGARYPYAAVLPLLRNEAVIGALILVGDARDPFTALDDRFLVRSEEHTSELQSQSNLVCRLLLEKKKVTAH